MNWAIVQNVLFLCGSLCFVSGTLIGLVQAIGRS
jgi:hypothetical protein